MLTTSLSASLDVSDRGGRIVVMFLSLIILLILMLRESLVKISLCAVEALLAQQWSEGRNFLRFPVSFSFGREKLVELLLRWSFIVEFWKIRFLSEDDFVSLFDF